MSYILSTVLKEKLGGYVSADEIGLYTEQSGLALPAGSTAMWTKYDFAEV